MNLELRELSIKMDIKDKSYHIFTICQGCLSADRTLKCITGQNKALFIKLREDVMQNEKDTRGLLLCWECVALLNKMKYFQARIKTAQLRLVQYLQTFYDNMTDIPHTLSPLLKSIHIANEYNYTYKEDQKDTYLEQNISQQNILEQKDLILDQKEETNDEKVLLDIKLEDDEIIKEEYEDSLNNDTDYYEQELKQETDEDSSLLYRRKKTFKTKFKSRIKKYEEYAIVTKIHERFPRNVSPYYDIVYVSTKELEQVYLLRATSRYDKTLPYRCVDCKMGYNVRLDLLRHQSFNHLEPQYPTNCLACKREILSSSHLEDHWTKNHNPMLRCTFCGELSRTKGELKKHLNRSHTKKLTCNSCALEFRTLGEFSKHYKMAHERFICDYCNRNVCSKRTLEAHIKRKHLPGHCSICSKDYRTYQMLELHLQRVHPELVPHLIQETRKELRYCVECDIQYPSVLKYKRHLQQSVRHRPKKKVRIPCPACDKKFSRTIYKNNHYRLVHIKETKHYCELCNKYFANGYGIRTHILHVHQKVPKIKDKICDLCGRAFNSNRILNNHRRTHTGERPYNCPHCPASFAQQTAMKSHLKSQHKNFNLPTLCNAIN